MKAAAASSVKCIERALQSAEVLQVELNGHYSPPRIQEFAAYHRKTSTAWAVLICVGTVVPCLVIPTLLDCAPLPKPSVVVSDNWLLFIRQFFTWWVFGFLASYQASHFVSVLGLTKLQLVAISTIAAAGSTACSFAAAAIITFPVPFTFAGIAPLWMTQVFTLVALTWMSRLRRTPEAWPHVISLFKVWACQCCIVPIYPIYLFAWTSLPEPAQIPFACLLPVLRLLVRNWFSRALEHLRDEMSEVVILNADVFSALFVAYCMQTVPSMWGIGGLMAIDLAQICIAMRDVNRFLQRIHTLRTMIDAERETPSVETSLSLTTTRKVSSGASVLAQADAMLAAHFGAPSARIKRGIQSVVKRRDTRIKQTRVRQAGQSIEQTNSPTSSTPALHKVTPLPPYEADVQGTKEQEMRPIDEESKRCASGRRWLSSALVAVMLTPLEQEFVETVGRLLFFTEFLLLLNYVEVVIPTIYGASVFAAMPTALSWLTAAGLVISLSIMYSMPNRDFYSVLANNSDQELESMLLVVTIYGLLELTSLVVFVWAVSRKLRVSAMVQIAFLFEKQWDGVQVKFAFWVLYSSQTLLQHFGYDFSYQFTWVRERFQ